MRSLALSLVLASAAVVAGEPKHEAPKRLSGITWYRSLDDARKKAADQPRHRPARPVLWLRMLGDLAGKT